MFWTPYALFPLFAGALTLGLGLYAWRRRAWPGALAFVVMSFSANQWAFGYSLELIATDLNAKLFWDNFQFFGSALLSPALLIFSWAYTRRMRFNPLLQRLLFIEPFVTCALAYTNPWHGLIRSAPHLDFTGPFPTLVYTYGPWLWGAVLYDYALMTLAFVWLGQRFFRLTGFYRRQILIIFIGLGLPYFGTLLTVLGLLPLPVPNLDISPVTFAVGFAIMAWGIFRYQLLDILPVAREVVFDAMRDPVIALDSQDRLVDFNPAARVLLTNAGEGVIGRKASQVVQGWAEQIQPYRTMPTGFEVTRLQVGEERFYHVGCFPMRNTRQEMLGQVLTWHDITDRHRAEQTMLRLNEELEVRVIERTRDLQLAKDAAEAASRAKSEFLANISHELRTPLNGIIGYAEILIEGDDGPLNEPQSDSAQNIRANGKNLLHLIESLLDFSRLEAAESDRATHFNVEELLEDVVRQFMPAALGKSLALHYALPPDLPEMVLGDAPRVKQVLTYLVDNAIKFTATGEVEITTRVLHRTTDKIQLEFNIRDTGIGLSADHVTKIFQSFTQVDGSSTRRYGGLGIGLALSKRLVEMLGGEISVTSELGQGSYFHLRLPFTLPT